ncbi:hypothetical protein JCM3774_002768 [Rhodotorula dairenensis]
MSERAKYTRQARARVSSYAVDIEGDSTDDEKATSVMNKHRPKGKKGARGAAGEDSDAMSTASADDGNNPHDKPRKKSAKKKSTKKKKTKASGKGKKLGKLESINVLPLELLGEIFSHVGPNTLLALRLVNKEFHAFLTAKSSEHLWKAARHRADLPDIEGLSEMQYAELMFGKTCQGCYGEKVGKIYHDLCLRKNLCKRCRRSKIVSVKRLAETAPEVAARLHPLATQCVLRTHNPGTKTRTSYLGDEKRQGDYANLDDLWYYDSVLRDLDAQDEDSDIEAQREPDEADTPHSIDYPARRSSRPRRYGAASWQSYKEESESEDENAREVFSSRRGKEYAAARVEKIESVCQMNPRLEEAHFTASTYHKMETRECARRGSGLNRSHWKRSDEIVRRLIQEDPSLDRAIFRSPHWYRASKRFLPGPVLTDEEWDRINKQVHAACARALSKIAADKLAAKQDVSAWDLRPRYEQLLEDLDEGARPLAPLFTDFLLLSSVKEFWVSGTEVDDAKWANQLPLIQEELDDYRLELVLHARREILAATTTSAPGTCEDDDVESVDANFFELATSFVCCSFKDCPKKRTSAWGRWWWPKRAAKEEDRQDGWIGPLVDVLKHQHDAHNKPSSLPAKATKTPYPPFRVCLPLEVACGIESLLELHDLDGAKAKKRHLDLASKKILAYEWVNSGVHRRYYGGGKSAWATLLGWIKREGEAAAKTGLFLDPPEIRFKRISDKKLDLDLEYTEDDDDDDDEDEDSGDDEGDDDEVDKDGEDCEVDEEDSE